MPSVLTFVPWATLWFSPKNGTKTFSITFESEQANTVLPSSTWFHIWLEHYSSFQLLLPQPLSLGCGRSKSVTQPLQHPGVTPSNHNKEYTNNHSPPANKVKNSSFSTMHFTLELLRRALGICGPTDLPLVPVTVALLPWSVSMHGTPISS